ncbi:hypothetical protein KJ885_03585 [Patescibacteria group bacterium]|nr:hypothetical protein [Patescibacteria group bacterium]
MDKRKPRHRQRRRPGNKRESRKGRNRHHLNPGSRKDDVLRLLGEPNPPHELFQKICRTKKVDSGIHDAWHRLFSNMLAWEAILQIKLWANENLSAFSVHLNRYQKTAWNKIFGPNAAPKEAIEIIEKDWWPAHPAIEEVGEIKE